MLLRHITIAVPFFNTNNLAQFQVLPAIEFSFNSFSHSTLTSFLQKFVSDCTEGVIFPRKTTFNLKLYDKNDTKKEGNISIFSSN